MIWFLFDQVSQNFSPYDTNMTQKVTFLFPESIIFQYGHNFDLKIVGFVHV